MYRRNFIMGMASLIAAPAVLARHPILTIQDEKRQNEVFDFRDHDGEIYISWSSFVCCRFVFSPVSRLISIRNNYTEFCTFEGILNVVERDMNVVVGNVFASSTFPDIKDPQYLNRRKTSSFADNYIETLEVGSYCVSPTS